MTATIYLNKHENCQWWDKSWAPKTYKLPGGVNDTTHQCIGKASKWHKRPMKARKLYWRYNNTSQSNPAA